jgi:hypothetical protein
MIVVEVGHAHVITFLQLSCELSFCQCHCHFLGEKCGDAVFIYFCLKWLHLAKGTEKFILGILLILLSLRPWGVVARAVTLENRGRKSLFSNIAYENDSFITQFSEENRHLHH